MNNDWSEYVAAPEVSSSLQSFTDSIRDKKKDKYFKIRE